MPVSPPSTESPTRLGSPPSARRRARRWRSPRSPSRSPRSRSASPIGGFSRVTEIALRSGDERRTVELTPDAAGRSLAVVDPPLPAGPLVLELAVVETATTIDRRYGDVIELPAAISEIVIAGAPQPDRLGCNDASVRVRHGRPHRRDAVDGVARRRRAWAARRRPTARRRRANRRWYSRPAHICSRRPAPTYRSRSTVWCSTPVPARRSHGPVRA